ncbi:hypothetical protein [Verrucomicrobium spinosum]|uniref:hypothetical protein n=1 Tax=Verrucomicrobium spinosum TaxID=2736 RepID=UPI0012E1E2DE|nr:hypothetical protein [Verrucomicrobium spinosum]
MPPTFAHRILPYACTAVLWAGGMTWGNAAPPPPSPVAKVDLAAREEYQAALRASSEGLHDVAALKYERLLKDRSLSKKEEAQVGERMVDALVRARNSTKRSWRFLSLRCRRPTSGRRSASSWITSFVRPRRRFGPA